MATQHSKTEQQKEDQIKIAWRKTTEKERNTAGCHCWNASKTAARQRNNWKEIPEDIRNFNN